MSGPLSAARTTVRVGSSPTRAAPQAFVCTAIATSRATGTPAAAQAERVASRSRSLTALSPYAPVPLVSEVIAILLAAAIATQDPASTVIVADATLGQRTWRKSGTVVRSARPRSSRSLRAPHR